MRLFYLSSQNEKRNVKDRRKIADACLRAHRDGIVEGLTGQLRRAGGETAFPAHEALFDLVCAGVRDASSPLTVADVHRIVAGSDLQAVIAAQMDLWALLHRMLRQAEWPPRELHEFPVLMTLVGDASDGVIGALIAIARTGGPSTPLDPSLVNIPLGRRTLVELGKARREFHSFTQIMGNMLNIRDPARMFELIERSILDTFHLRSLSIAAVNHKAGIVEIIRAYPTDPLTDAPVGWTYDLSHPDIFCDVVRTGRSEVIDGWDPRYHERVVGEDGSLAFRQRPGDFNAGHTAFFIPIRAEGQTVGVIATAATQANKEIVRREIERMQPFLHNVGIALLNFFEIAERRQAEDALNGLAAELSRANEMLWEKDRLLTAFHHQASEDPGLYDLYGQVIQDLIQVQRRGAGRREIDLEGNLAAVDDEVDDAAGDSSRVYGSVG